MAQRSTLRILAAILGGVALVMLVAGMLEWASAADSPDITKFDQAEFVASSARRPPDDRAAWKTVTLPDEWSTRPDIKGKGWYRIKVNLDHAPTGLRAVFVRSRRARRVSFFVNGTRIGGSREETHNAAGRAGSGTQATLGLGIPPHLLRAGENTIHVRMEGSVHPAKFHGLGRLYFGDARPLRRMRIWRNVVSTNAKRAATILALAAGIMTLFLWLARRRDRVMFWFSVACLFWGSVGFAYTKIRWEGAAQLTSLLYFCMNYGLVVPTMILSLRTVDLKWPRFEVALWLFFLFEISYPLWPGKPWPGALLAWDATNVALLLGVVGMVFHAARWPLEWPIKLQIGALAAMAAFMSYEFARYFGWVPVESPEMRHYHVPMMLLAMGAACFERHARAIKTTESTNVELEQRVAEKAREIEMNHARIETALRERTLANERQRILADMHDGLGATLVSLLRHVQGGQADHASLRGRVQEALQEMRAAINAMQPRGGDLTSVIGSLRERLDGLVSGGGLHLVWQVDDLPGNKQLTPSALFSLQRILLEAVGNSLKHSNAKEIRFVACARDSGGIEIRVEDDGHGFDSDQTRSGLGIANMRTRAERIGARLEMTSRPGKGTVVRVTIPGGVPATPIEPVNADSEMAPARWTRTPGIAGIVLLATTTLLTASYAPHIEAASPRKVIEFDRARFVQSHALRPPNDSAPWKPVALPDQWRTHPGLTGPVWYRMDFNLERAPSGLQAIMVRHRRAYGVAFFVNDKLVGTARDNQSMAGSRNGLGLGTPIRHNVLANMLRVGKNVIHVRMEGSPHPALGHGLGRVYFGDARPVRRIYNRAIELGFSAKRQMIYLALAAGLIAFFMWLARQSDRVMLWFSISCLSWGTVGSVYLMWRWSDWTVVSSLLLFYTVYGLVIPTLILSLRTVDLKWPRIEAGLWSFFLIEISYPLWGEGWPFMHVVWDAANSALLLGAFGIVLGKAPRPLRWPIKLQLAALAAMATVIAYEIGRYLGWVDIESTVIRHYHVPLMLVAMGAACFDRYAHAIRQAERTTGELEQRVAEKVREIEENHARVEEARREYALSQERQRILDDVHDGLGASLVSLLRYIDSGHAELSNVERRVQEALQEMRVAIDALQPHGGNLAAALGSLRERLDGLLAGSGVHLTWRVDELPQVDELSPSSVFSLQRIVLEAVGNALKHSSANEVLFAALLRQDGDIEVRVEDNGRGFDLARAHGGPGLTNMRARADRIDAGLEITCRPGGGTVVRLTIPRAAPIPGAERAGAQTESTPLLLVVPTTQPA